MSLDEETAQDEKITLTFAKFLESVPPNQRANVSDLVSPRSVGSRGQSPIYQYIPNTPELQLYCSSDACSGIRFFRPHSSLSAQPNPIQDTGDNPYFLTYRCSNCGKTTKTYSLLLNPKAEDGSFSGSCYKLGEFPTFGPPVSPRLIKLIGPDKEIFLKGRRCENQGLGIGAFTYYRRVVENQKNRILGEIIKVAERLGAGQNNLDALNTAVSETQFSRALDIAKDVIPENLLIGGHSPLKLLHSALSEGIHALSDEECLEKAAGIRLVLGELSERLSEALKDEAELMRAVSALMNKK